MRGTALAFLLPKSNDGWVNVPIEGRGTLGRTGRRGRAGSMVIRSWSRC